MKVNGDTIILSAIAGGLSALLVLTYEAGSTQAQIISIEKNYGTLSKSITDDNIASRENLRDLRGELSKLRGGLTRHYESHAEHGKGEDNEHTEN